MIIAGYLQLEREARPLPIELRLDPQQRISDNDFQRLLVRGRQGVAKASTAQGLEIAPQPLAAMGELGRFEAGLADQMIHHKDLRPVVYVMAARDGRPDSPLVTASIGLRVVGAIGIALGVRHQQTAEHSTVYGQEYDEVAARLRSAEAGLALARSQQSQAEAKRAQAAPSQKSRLSAILRPTPGFVKCGAAGRKRTCESSPAGNLPTPSTRTRLLCSQETSDQRERTNTPAR